jgi:hypothetical protein
MAGYGGLTSRLSTGTHDPITARALALGDGTDIAVIVSSDILIVNEQLEREVMRRIHAQGLDLRDEQVMISATHTHAGPGGYDPRLVGELVLGSETHGMREYLAEGIAKAVVQAVRGMKPGEVGFGRADVPECVVNRVDEDGTNPRLDIMACRAKDGTRAVLLNYAAHPTVLNGENTLYSGDFPAAACRALEQDGAFAIYTAGTVGGQRPGKNGRKHWDAVEWVGGTLADRARTTLRDITFTDRADIRTLQGAFLLPPPQVRLTPISNYLCLPGCLSEALTQLKQSNVQFLAINDKVFYGTPCDMGWDVGLALIEKAKAQGLDLTVLSHCEGYTGYTCREERYWNGKGVHYEGLMSFHGPHMDQYYKDLLGKAIERLQQPGR